MLTGPILLIILLASANLAGTSSDTAIGCTNYSALDEADRAQGFALPLQARRDTHLTTGWYRFQGAAGDRMPDKCVLRFRCGTKHPGWLNGTHPTIADGEVTRTVCFSAKTNCCSWNATIKVKNCSSYYVYKLQGLRCYRCRYCGNAGAVNGCKNYSSLGEADRAQGNGLQPYTGCGMGINTGWYRFQGAAEVRIPDKCVLRSRCGTRNPGWLNGTHPTIADGEATRTVCFSWNTTCCLWRNMIKVKNCSSYYVYELQRSPSCNYRYHGNDSAVTTAQTPRPATAATTGNNSNSNRNSCMSKATKTTSAASTAAKTAAATTTSATATTQETAGATTAATTATFAMTAESTTTTAATTTTSSTTLKTTAITQLEKKFISALDKIDVLQNTSFQEAVNLFEKTTELYKNIDIEDVGKQKRWESILSMAVIFERFVLNYSHYHLSESKPQIKFASNSLASAIWRSSSQNVTDLLPKESGRQTSITIPSTNLNDNETVVVAIAYKDLHELFVANHSNGEGHNNPRRLSTIIVAIMMDPKPDKLTENVTINFKHLKVTEGMRLCVFWSGVSEKSPDGWSTEGCHAVKSTSSAEETECSCNHLTHFAVLLDYSDANSKLTKMDNKILRILSYVGLALSVTGLTLSIILYAVLTDVHQPLSQIRMSLAGSLGTGQIIFLSGIGVTENMGTCVTVAALLQYFLMVALCWMLIEGIYFYLLVVKVYNIENKMCMYHLMSWGFPAIIVAMTLSIAGVKDGIQSFVDDEYCWMSSHNNLIWIFVAIVLGIEIFILLILARVVKEITSMQPTAGDNNIHQIRRGIKACLVMSPLLGITWLFGLLMPLHKAFVYIFTILNSTQGMFIFLLHCARNNQFRERFKRRLNVIFPAVNDPNPARKSSRVKPSVVGTVQIIEVQPYSGVSEMKEQ